MLAGVILAISLTFDFLLYRVASLYSLVPSSGSVVGNMIMASGVAFFYMIFIAASKNIVQDLRDASPASLASVYTISYLASGVPGNLLIPLLGNLQYSNALATISFLIFMLMAGLITVSSLKLKECADGKTTALHPQHYGSHRSLQQLPVFR